MDAAGAGVDGPLEALLDLSDELDFADELDLSDELESDDFDLSDELAEESAPPLELPESEPLAEFLADSRLSLR